MARRLFLLLTSALLLCVPCIETEARVVISELMWSGTDLSSSDEWLELANIGTGSVNMSGWTLTKLSKGEEQLMFRIPKNTMIASGGLLVISNFAESKSRLSFTPDIVENDISLSNTKLLIRLYTGAWVAGSTGNLLPVDAVDDGIGKPFAGSNDTPKASMERIDLSGSGQDKSNWRTATTFINFDDGAKLFGTPAASNGTGATTDTQAPKEAMQLFAEYKESGSIVEVNWIPSTSLDVQEQTLSFDPPIGDETYRMFDATSTGTQFAGGFVSGTGITFVLRTTDDNGNTSSGVSTISVRAPHVLITEVLANPVGKDDEEWIEIGNLGLDAVDVSGWILDEGNSKANYTIEPRNASGFVLQPQEHVIFTKSRTNLPLDNKGEQLTLHRGAQLMDSWEYVETGEEISYGRTASGVLQAFCSPTPNKPNVIALPQPAILIQSGEASAENKVTLNLQAALQTGSIKSAQCRWDYGDGYTSESCNPPSHTFREFGSYTITLGITNACDESGTGTLTATVINPTTQEQGGPTTTIIGSTENKTVKREQDCTPTTFSGVSLSEFLPNPIGSDAEGEWIELYNNSAEEASLCGWQLDDGDGGSKPFYLDGRTIQPHAFHMIPRTHSKIAINNADEYIRLFSPNETLIESIGFVKSREGETYALREDGHFVWTPYPTPGEANMFRTAERLHPHDTVIVSGALPNPDGKDDGNEWIEITNVSEKTMHLDGWIVDNREGGSAPYSIEKLTLKAGRTHRFVQSETDIQLTNTFDQARLLDPDGSIVSLLSWHDAVSGRVYIPSKAGEKEEARVTKVIDGDTLEVSIEGRMHTVRMIGVDTPETVHPHKPVEILGQEAKEFTQQRLLNKTITLQYDAERLDKYDRLLAYALLQDGTNMNGELIRHGYSYAYLRYPFTLSDLFIAYEEEARNRKLGLWAEEEVVTYVEEEKERVVQEVVYETEGLTLALEPKSGIVASGTIITFSSNIPADIYASWDSGTAALLGVSGSARIIITDDITITAYADTGSGVRSKTITAHYLLAQPTYDMLVQFSEVMSNPPRTGALAEMGEYIELYNPTGSAAHLGGWIVDDKPAGSSAPYTLPMDTVIGPQERLMLPSTQTELSLNNEGEELWLSTPNRSRAITLLYPPMKRGQSFAVHPKQSNAWCLTSTPTPDSSNRCRVSAHAPKKKAKKVQRTTAVANHTEHKVQPPSTTSPVETLRMHYRPIFSHNAKNQGSMTHSPLLNAIRMQRMIPGSASSVASKSSLLTTQRSGMIALIMMIVPGIGLIAYSRKYR